MNFSLQLRVFYVFREVVEIMKVYIVIPEQVYSRSVWGEGAFRYGEIMSPEVCPDWILEGMPNSRWEDLTPLQVGESDCLPRIPTSSHPDFNSSSSSHL